MESTNNKSDGNITVPRRHALSMLEIEAMLDEANSDNEDDYIHSIYVLPPDHVDDLTDNEDINDEDINGNENPIAEVAGSLEWVTHADVEGDSEAPIVQSSRRSARNCNTLASRLLIVQEAEANADESNEDLSEDDDEDYAPDVVEPVTYSPAPSTSSATNSNNRLTTTAGETTTATRVRQRTFAVAPSSPKRPAKRTATKANKRPRKRKSKKAKVVPSARFRVEFKAYDEYPTAEWRNIEEAETPEVLPYSIACEDEPLGEIRAAFSGRLRNKSPLQLFQQFFDKEVLNFITEQTKQYARQKNDLEFAATFNSSFLKRFLGILLLSGIAPLPALRDYWSTNLALGNQLVKQTMSRTMFEKIKRYIHFTDNMVIDTTDKMAKVRALFDLLNKKFTQFGIWERDLSIDEQMVPYFGRHSCKQFIRGKPIRFGYKLWCMCSAQGYLYFAIPYAGSSDQFDEDLGQGASVILAMTKNIEFPARHMLYFDNFFTSHYLMCTLADKQLCATGTVRKNRDGGPPLKTGKKLPKGENDAAFDDANKILACRWQDKKEVTLLTNHDVVQPYHTAQRRQKAVLGDPITSVKQPRLIRNYNAGMGGVDLHDNAVSNYRVAIRSKKWYWPLWIATLESAAVNAWKLQCFVEKATGKKQSHQKDFRVALLTSLMLTPDEDDLTAANQDDDKDEVSADIPCNMESRLPRRDGNHIQITHPDKKTRRCKVCHKGTQKMCQKCNVHLHQNTCFMTYHQMV